ncbi:dTDP-4-dehydrorhamnose 3,5-epimerase family protein [Streptomyces maoxianensis]|uniref:dTDP-4-dehydrorhamnose 3,5-epimerase family protein n=1 Tax=Streptomyces maoxianensis TaxID=1459942 RepID=A0ABV9GEG4_9ACTN|nr:dTDP-4-dehydrorhamnose 3,5-epimerase family protein [Streptomyces sp. ISL-1]MBT2388400.1 dTDP-4-dehydrorhamnose 3,5-epimerase family protein [Streptomyces sp. ISL-1]
MESRELKVAGALAFTPQVFKDSRGLFVSPFQEEAFVEATGRPLFAVSQTSYSRSRRGVVRGVHFTRTPPGMAKYVYCAQGQALDIVVDIRVGSPTFGQCDAVVLDPVEFRALYLPVGVGHAFVALRDETVMSYTLSRSYVAENELALSVFDPELNLPLPDGIRPVVSDRDRVAPSLAQARADGLLPDHAQCMEIERALAPRRTTP